MICFFQSKLLKRPYLKNYPNLNKLIPTLQHLIFLDEHENRK
nr:hypothetical protein [Lactobacillus crispatus]